MLKMFAPRAETPPSANIRHWTISTAEMTTTAALGPSSTAARTAPIRCPEVPPATGKLIIWAANTNAAARPEQGNAPGGQVRARVAQGDGHPRRGKRPRRDGGPGVQEPVRDVHVPSPSQLRRAALAEAAGASVA